MINMFVKSALFYTFFRKYGKKVIFVIANLFFILFVYFVYVQVVEYLTLSEMKDKLLIALLVEIGLILISISLIIYTITSPFRRTNTPIKVEKTPSLTEEETSEVEEEVRKKPELQSHGDKLIEEMKKTKK